MAIVGLFWGLLFSLVIWLTLCLAWQLFEVLR